MKLGTDARCAVSRTSSTARRQINPINPVTATPMTEHETRPGLEEGSCGVSARPHRHHGRRGQRRALARHR
jgi:hypothetical protein